MSRKEGREGGGLVPAVMVRSVSCTGSSFFHLVVFRLSVVHHGPLVRGLRLRESVLLKKIKNLLVGTGIVSLTLSDYDVSLLSGVARQIL